MAEKQTAPRWTLEDLADFEALLAEEGSERGAKRIYREEIAPQLPAGLDEGERRRQGLRRWLDIKRDDQSSVGKKLGSGLRLTAWLARVLGLLLGVGIVRGLLQESPLGSERGFNIWLFLAVTIGLQWLFLLGGGFGWLAFGRKGRLTLPQEFLGFLGRKFSGGKVSELWSRLLKIKGDGYGSVLGWRLGSITQLAGAWLNFGIVIGFVAMLFVFSLSFFWESTLASFSESQLVNVTNVLSLPWFFLGDQWRPGSYGVEQTSLEYYRNSASSWSGPGEVVNQVWMRFIVLAILVWGVLPRLLLNACCALAEKRSLRGLDFQEPRHRNLWREMAKTERSIVQTSQADGVVVLDVGGAGVTLDQVRPFLLQQLRSNPEAIYQTGVLDSTKEEAAAVVMKSTEMGVVMVVEGWSLSGPQMRRNYERVRKLIGEKKRICFLVVGTVKESGMGEVSEAELVEWTKFVDALRDPATEVVKWEATNLNKKA